MFFKLNQRALSIFDSAYELSVILFIMYEMTDFIHTVFWFTFCSRRGTNSIMIVPTGLPVLTEIIKVTSVLSLMFQIAWQFTILFIAHDSSFKLRLSELLIVGFSLFRGLWFIIAMSLNLLLLRFRFWSFDLKPLRACWSFLITLFSRVFLILLTRSIPILIFFRAFIILLAIGPLGFGFIIIGSFSIIRRSRMLSLTILLRKLLFLLEVFYFLLQILEHLFILIILILRLLPTIASTSIFIFWLGSRMKRSFFKNAFLLRHTELFTLRKFLNSLRD